MLLGQIGHGASRVWTMGVNGWLWLVSTVWSTWGCCYVRIRPFTINHLLLIWPQETLLRRHSQNHFSLSHRCNYVIKTRCIDLTGVLALLLRELVSHRLRSHPGPQKALSGREQGARALRPHTWLPVCDGQGQRAQQPLLSDIQGKKHILVVVVFLLSWACHFYIFSIEYAQITVKE